MLRACLYLAPTWKAARGLKGAFGQSAKYNRAEKIEVRSRFVVVQTVIVPQIEDGSANEDVVRVPVLQQDCLCSRGEDGRRVSMAQGLLQML